MACQANADGAQVQDSHIAPTVKMIMIITITGVTRVTRMIMITIVMIVTIMIILGMTIETRASQG